MKIIKKGTIPNTTRRLTCCYCGCVFECDANEYRYHSSQRDGDWVEANCPTCGKVVAVDILTELKMDVDKLENKKARLELIKDFMKGHMGND